MHSSNQTWAALLPWDFCKDQEDAGGSGQSPWQGAHVFVDFSRRGEADTRLCAPRLYVSTGSCWRGEEGKGVVGEGEGVGVGHPPWVTVTTGVEVKLLLCLWAATSNYQRVAPNLPMFILKCAPVDKIGWGGGGYTVGNETTCTTWNAVLQPRPWFSKIGCRKHGGTTCWSKRSEFSEAATEFFLIFFTT